MSNHDKANAVNYTGTEDAHEFKLSEILSKGAAHPVCSICGLSEQAETHIEHCPYCDNTGLCAPATAAQPETSTISVARYCDGKSTFFSVKRGGETLYRFPNEREANQFKRSLERAQCSPPKSERTYTADEVAKLLAASERTARATRDKLAEALRSMRRELKACARDCMTEKKSMRWVDDNEADIEAKAALADYDASKGGAQ